MGGTDAQVKAQFRSASGRSSRVIKDRQRVEATVTVPEAGRLILSVDGEGRYVLRASLDGGEAPASIPLAAGALRPAEREPD